MESDVCGVFLDALCQVFSETGIAIDCVETSDRRGSADQVVTSVGIAGGVKGNLMLSTDYACAASIVKAMSHGISVVFPGGKLGEIQKTALGELSNQITGRAITILSEKNIECEIAPPIIITGESLSSHVPDIVQAFSRVVRGPFGSLTLLLALAAPPVPE
jgi:chemotaxis protein CheX